MCLLQLKACEAAPLQDPQSVRASTVAPTRPSALDALILLSSLPRETHLISLFFCLRDRVSASPRQSGAVRQEVQWHPHPPNYHSERWRERKGCVLTTQRQLDPKVFGPNKCFLPHLFPFYFFFFNLFYCHFGSDKNVSHKPLGNPVVFYMFGIGAFFLVSGKLISSYFEQD